MLKHKLFTEREAAELLGMTIRMVADRRRAGKIGSFKDGHYIGFTEDHLEAYIKAHMQQGRTQEESEDDALLRSLTKRLKPKHR